MRLGRREGGRAGRTSRDEYCGGQEGGLVKIEFRLKNEAQRQIGESLAQVKCCPKSARRIHGVLCIRAGTVYAVGKAVRVHSACIRDMVYRNAAYTQLGMHYA